MATAGCATWETAVSALVDGALDPSEEAQVQAHLAQCEGCRAAHAELEAVVGALHALPAAPPAAAPDAAFARLWQALDAEPSAPETTELATSSATAPMVHATPESLSAYAEGALDGLEDARIHDHLVDCPACARSLVDLMAAMHALRRLPPVQPSTDPWPALLSRLLSEGVLRRRPSRAPLRPAAAGLIAAGLIAMLAGGLTYRNLSQPPKADLDAYWREHGIFSQAASSLQAPSVAAIQATYQMDEE